MKKIKLFMLSAIVVMGFGISSCGGDGPGGVGSKACENAGEAYTTALSNFSSSPSESTCDAWKSAFSGILSKCGVGEFLSQSQINDIQAQLDNLDCSAL